MVEGPSEVGSCGIAASRASEWLPGATESTGQREWDCGECEMLRSGPLPVDEAAVESWWPMVRREAGSGIAESVVAAEQDWSVYAGETARSGGQQGEEGDEGGY
jgi:hypothetical protein